MKFDASFGEAEALQLKAAILLYGGARGIRFASVHEPYRDPIGSPYLDAGRAITTEFLRTLAHELGRECLRRFFRRTFWHEHRKSRPGGFRRQ